MIGSITRYIIKFTEIIIEPIHEFELGANGSRN